MHFLLILNAPLVIRLVLVTIVTKVIAVDEGGGHFG